MAGKAKFDQEAAFKSIIGADRRPAEKLQEETEKPKKNKDRVQRAYFLDRDIDKALRRMGPVKIYAQNCLQTPAE